MPQNAYLKNGENVVLHKSISETEHVIERILVYLNEYGEVADDCPCGTKEIVSEVFLYKPIQKLESEFSVLNEKIASGNKQLKEIQDQLWANRTLLQKSQSELTETNKWKFDLSQFRTFKKNIVFFIKDRIEPVVITGKPRYTSDYWNLHLKINVHNGDLTYFTEHYESSFDDEWRKSYNNEAADPEYGFMFDLSDEEIVRITNERTDKMDLDKLHYTIKDRKIPEKYQTEKIKIWLEEKAQKKIENQRASIEAEIERKRLELDKLK